MIHQIGKYLVYNAKTHVLENAVSYNRPELWGPIHDCRTAFIDMLSLDLSQHLGAK